MTVAVGTTNPAKIESVRLGFETVWPRENWSFEGVKVDSGVPNQPMSDDDGVRGALTRARGARESFPDVAYGVGVEGNIRVVGDRWFQVGWVAVVDTEGREGIGGASSILIPENVRREIEQGKELGVVIDEVFSKENAKQKEGFFGIMTDGHVTRSEGYKDGVIMALSRFLHPEVF